MKPDCQQQAAGGAGIGSALLPMIITAIVLRTGAFGRRAHPKVLRIRASTERLFRPHFDTPTQS